MYSISAVLTEVKRMPLGLELQKLIATMWVWEPNSGSLEEKSGLSTTELSLQPYTYFHKETACRIPVFLNVCALILHFLHPLLQIEKVEPEDWHTRLCLDPPRGGGLSGGFLEFSVKE